MKPLQFNGINSVIVEVKFALLVTLSRARIRVTSSILHLSECCTALDGQGDEGGAQPMRCEIRHLDQLAVLDHLLVS